MFEDACHDVVAHIRRKGTAHRSLFFLDQYGWSDVALKTVREIFGTLNNPEVLLTFAVDALIDFLSEKTPETQALLNIELDREDVRALTDLRNGDGWRYLIQNGLYRHIRGRTGARFYTPFFIHSVQAHRSYWLLHLFRVFQGYLWRVEHRCPDCNIGVRLHSAEDSGAGSATRPLACSRKEGLD